MNRIATFTLLVAASFIPVCSALAQDHQVQAKIPFTFAVGDKWMPAGTYNIGSNTESATILTITDQTTKERAMAVGLPDHKDAGKTGKLVFHRVGNETDGFTQVAVTFLVPMGATLTTVQPADTLLLTAPGLAD